MSILIVQQRLSDAGFDPGPLDGKWGPRTASALDRAIGRSGELLAWGACVNAEFRHKARDISSRLGIDPSHLMAVIAFESAETFSPSIRNAAGSGATGLIQFMPSTAQALGTSVEALASMSAVEQLNYVERYFQPYRGRMSGLADVYMAVLWPDAIGRPEGHALWNSRDRPTTYRQNSGLDRNRDGVITKGEAAAKVRETLSRGMSPSNAWVGP